MKTTLIETAPAETEAPGIPSAMRNLRMFDSLLDDEECYRLLSAHDPRVDGRFFVGVSSTGIYCRAVCSAKLPKRENCTFYTSAAAAEAAGYRPCLKCRPELAPGIPATFEADRLARRAADMIENGFVSTSVSQIARRLNVSERHLRRVFEGTYGVTPTAYRNTARLLLAKSLLTDTALPVTRVAYACGFSSVRRFNDAFQQHYRMPPSRFRKNSADEPLVRENEITIRIGYRKPYRFDLILDFLRFRAIEGVEAVIGDTYARVVSIEALSSSVTCEVEQALLQEKAAVQDASAVGAKGMAECGWIKVSDMPAKSCLALSVSPELFGVLPSVIAKVKLLFDTDCFPDAVSDGLADFYGRVPTASRIEGIRLPCSFDGFEMAVRAILGQQITVKAANTLAGRVAAEFGQPAQTSVEGLNLAFPKPQAFCTEDAQQRLGELGVIRQRARAICALAQALRSGDIELGPGADTQEAARKLLALPGIGEWTTQYLLMRAFAYPDAFPASDYVVKMAFPDMKQGALEQMSRQWSPWRSYAVMSLWCTPHERATGG